MGKVIVVIMVFIIIFSGCSTMKWSEVPKDEKDKLVISGVVSIVWMVVWGFIYVNSTEPFEKPIVYTGY